MNKQPLISIIIPVYNTEKYVARCLDSVMAQTIKDIEIIAVNDGSKDASLSVLEEYASKDQRIHVIDVPNGGASRARNIGLSQSKGKYVGFVDSDDFISPEMYERMYSAAEKKAAEMAVCFFDTVEGTTFVKEKDANGSEELLGRDDAIIALTELVISYSVCTKLYRSDFIGSQRFAEDMVFAEDFRFNSELLLKASRVMLIREEFYHYYSREGSITHSPISEKDLVTLKVYDILSEGCADNPTVLKAISDRELMESQKLLDSSIGHDDISKESIRSMLARVKKNKSAIRKNKYLSFFGRIRSRLAILFPGLYVAAGSLFKKIRGISD